MNPKNQFGVAVIGLGRFGYKRLKAITANPRSRVRVVVDIDAERAKQMAGEFGCAHTSGWVEAFARADVDLVVVSTSTRYLAEISLAALEAGKHVLCEKPFARDAAEALPAVEESEARGLVLKVGYNHRYHPAIAQAHALVEENAIGRLHFLRCIYGHGGREGYDREWRGQAHLAGGGQLLDQGVHALDLFRWFAGEFVGAKAYTTTAFWSIAPLEDNAFALLQAENGCLASLQASWTQWKNTFAFEISGDAGYLNISGLGGRYGVERLIWGKRRGLGSAPLEQCFEFPGAQGSCPDESLEKEWTDFLDCVDRRREPQSSGRDAWRTLLLAEAIYRSARESAGALVQGIRQPAAAARAHCVGEQTG